MGNGKSILDWTADSDTVKNLFVWRKRVLIVDADGGIHFPAGVTPEKYFTLLEQWSRMLARKESPLQFRYPVWLVYREMREFFNVDFYLRVGMVLLPLMMWVISTQSKVNMSPAILFAVFTFLSLPCFLEKLRRRHVPYKGLTVESGTLLVSFLDGTRRKLPLNDSDTYYLDIKARNAFIAFKDGTRLIHLERVSYWPILRQRLLSKLEPEIHTSTQ